MATLPIAIPTDFLTEFCERNHIRKLSLFGSVLTDRFRPDSNVDMLVEFVPGAHITYFDLAGVEMEFSERLGAQGGPSDTPGVEQVF
jgi:uncharacterized protein